MSKSEVLPRIDQAAFPDWSLANEDTYDLSEASTPDVPSGITVKAVQEGILITVNWHTDKAHEHARFQSFIAYARPWGTDIADGTAHEIGRFSEPSWVWQQREGGYTGWEIALSAVTNTGRESAMSTFYRCVYSTKHDDFSGYGGSTISPLESRYWLKVAGFDTDESWVKYSYGTISSETSIHREGDRAIKVVTEFVPGSNYLADASLSVSLDLSDEGRFTDNDYVMLDLYASHNDGRGPAANTVFEILFFNTSTSDYFRYWLDINDVVVGWNYPLLKKSDFDASPGADWASIDLLVVDFGSQTNGSYFIVDDWRIVKADPDNANAANDTGPAWDFSDGTWHVIPGNRSGEPAWPFSLGQIESGGADYFFATAQNINVPNGRVSVPVYFKGADGRAGLHFRCADDTLGSEDCLAAMLDTAADKIYLVEWLAGGDAAVTNKVLNPSAEAAGNFGNYGSGTATADSTYAFKGSYSYKLVTTATAHDGMTLTLSALSNAAHVVSLWIRDDPTAPTYDPFTNMEFSLDNTNWHARIIIDMGNGWVRYAAAGGFPAGEANGSTTLYIRQGDGVARTVYFDAVQVEAAGTVTAYCDGSLGMGYAWTGSANASTSTREAGSPITWASASYTMATDTAYWVGADFKDDDNEGRVKVYVGTTEASLFTADAMRISYAIPSPWPDGNEVGLVARDCNVRFGEFRAGSPQAADYAHLAGSARALTDDRYGFKMLTTPLTSTDWDGDAKTGASGTIDLSTVFGAPAGIKAVSVVIYARDETVGAQFGLGPSAGFLNALYTGTQAANQIIGIGGVIPCDAAGDIYFYQSDELDAVYIYISGYAL